MLRLARRIDPQQENYTRFDDAYETIVAAVFAPAVYSYLTWRREQR